MEMLLKCETMKLQKLIYELTLIQQQYGNIDCQSYIQDDGYDGRYVSINYPCVNILPSSDVEEKVVIFV